MLFAHIIITVAALAILSSALPAFAQAAPGADRPRSEPGRAPDRALTYKQAPDAEGHTQNLQLHIYLPANWNAADRRPAIVFFFGGGFVGGNARQFFPQSEYFASRGLVAISADYRVKKGLDVCVEDARSTMRWLHTHAAELGIDPARIIAGGGSAGGYLATAVATGIGPDAAGEDATVPVRPIALVLFNPAYQSPGAGPKLGGVPDDALTAPWKRVDKTCPPSIMFFGTDDQFLAPGEAFAEKANQVGATSQIWTAAGQRHGFFNAPPWTAATLDKSDRFLAQLGLLTGELTINVEAAAALQLTVPTSRPAASQR